MIIAIEEIAVAINTAVSPSFNVSTKIYVTIDEAARFTILFTTKIVFKTSIHNKSPFY